MPKMKHESGGRQIDADADMVPMYESQGWRKVTATPSKSTSSKTSEPSTDSK